MDLHEEYCKINNNMFKETVIFQPFTSSKHRRRRPRVDPLPQHTRARSPLQIIGLVRVLERRDGIACNGPAVQNTHVERAHVHTFYAKEGMLEVFLVWIECVFSTGCGTTNSFPVFLCVALVGFAVWCEGVRLLLVVAQ